MQGKPRLIEEHHNLPGLDPEPRLNIAPTDVVPILTNQAPENWTFARWGLVPGWASDPKEMRATFNARIENLATTRLWAEPFRRRRCLVPADGFYEWPEIDGRKRPVRIGLHGQPFAFAGLWDEWRSRDTGEVLRSCTIITCEPNAFMSAIHDRMAIILPENLWTAWLAPEEQTPERLYPILQSVDGASMSAEPCESPIPVKESAQRSFLF
jgi:putative SOS response-associated peptidase YedK